MLLDLLKNLDAKTLLLIAVIVAQLFMGKQIDIDKLLEWFSKPSLKTQIKVAQLALDEAQKEGDATVEAAARKLLERLRKRSA
jgi:hypothetical protein